MSVSIELPLARALGHALGRERALDIIPLLAADDDARSEAAMALNARIEIYPNEHEEGGHVVQAVLALREPTETRPGHAMDDGVYWDNMSVVARGRRVPDTALALCEGRAMTDVLDHPHLAGLVITDASDFEGEALVLEADGAMVRADRLADLL